MHERSLVGTLLQQIQELAEHHHASRVTRVELRVGEFSGVDGDLLRLAFDEMKLDSIARDADLRISSVPLRGRCGACSQDFDIKKYKFTCPACDSDAVSIVQGDELVLDRLQLETPE